MATGRLATLDISSANTDTQLYAVPSSKVASFTICMTNRTASNAKVRIAFTDTTSIGTDEYIAYDVTIMPYEVYERSGLVLTQGQYVYVRSTITGVNAVAWGYEE